MRKLEEERLKFEAEKSREMMELEHSKIEADRVRAEAERESRREIE